MIDNSGVILARPPQARSVMVYIPITDLDISAGRGRNSTGVTNAASSSGPIHRPNEGRSHKHFPKIQETPQDS